MTFASEPSPGMLAFGLIILVTLVALFLKVKLRGVSARWFGVRVYDFGADFKLPRALHSRSYQFALYLTLKSLPREGGDASRSLNGPAP